MDLEFKCPHCDQELAVDAEAVGSEIDCPSCSKSITVPALDQNSGGQEGSGSPPTAPAPTPAAAAPPAPKEHKHFAVPLRDSPSEVLIEKPLPPLDAANKDTEKKIRVKCIKHHDCVEVGKDKFDQIVADYLNTVGHDNVVSITSINYSHVDISTRAVVTDFGVMIIYRG